MSSGRCWNAECLRTLVLSAYGRLIDQSAAAGQLDKTRLDIEAGQRMLTAVIGATHSSESQIQDLQFSDGICFVVLAPMKKAELVLETIAQSLEL